MIAVAIMLAGAIIGYAVMDGLDTVALALLALADAVRPGCGQAQEGKADDRV